MFFIPASALLIIPPAEVCDRIDVWRRRFDPHAELIPPHVTLAYPPFASVEQWPVMCLGINELVESIQPFEITLEGVDVTSGIPQVLWLHARDDGALPRLRGLLETRFPALVQPLLDGFTPHLTVGQFEEDAPLAAARAELESGWEPLHFEADRLFFAVQTPDRRWQMRDFVRLGCPDCRNCPD